MLIQTRLARPTLLTMVEGLFLLTVLATLAAGETTSIKLKEPNPFLRQSTLVLANIALALVVLAQVGRNFLRRKKKYTVAKDQQAAAKPSGAPKAARVTCEHCKKKIEVRSAARPARYRCPHCKETGVLR